METAPPFSGQRRFFLSAAAAACAAAAVSVIAAAVLSAADPDQDDNKDDPPKPVVAPERVRVAHVQFLLLKKCGVLRRSLHSMEWAAFWLLDDFAHESILI